jgi:hypothetical protein
MPSAAAIAAAALSLAFAWAGISKLVARGRWRRAVDGHPLPRVVRPAVVAAVPIAELAVAALALAGRAEAAAAAAAAMLVTFSLSILAARARGRRRLPCGCFGGRPERDYRALLLRNAALGALAATVLAAGDLSSLTGLGTPRGGELAAVALALAGLALAGWGARETLSLFRRS